MISREEVRAALTGPFPSLKVPFHRDGDIDYAVEAEIWLRSPVIDLTAVAGATLNFSHYVDIEEGFDSGQIRLLDADAANAELAILQTAIDDILPLWPRAVDGEHADSGRN